MAGNYNVITATKNPQRILSWMVKQNDSVLLINSDITNSAFIGNDVGSQPIPIPPLGSVTINYNSKDVWISTTSANVIIYEMPNGSQWTPSPAQIATQINALGLAKDTSVQTVNTTLGTPAQKADVNQVNTTLGIPAQSADVSTLGGAAGRSIASDMLNANKKVTTEIAALLASGNAAGTPGGVPLLRNTVNLGSAVGQTIAGGQGPNLVNTTAVNQPGYEGVLSLQMPLNTGTIPFAKLTVVWTDSTTTLTVGQRTFFLSCGNGSLLSYYIHGPTKGNQVSVTLLNLDPSVTLTVTWGFNLTSHIYMTDNIIQTAYGVAPNGFTNPNGTPNAGVIANASPTILSNATTTRLIACYSGKAIMIGNNTSAAGVNVNAFLVDPIASGSGLYGAANARLGGLGVVNSGQTLFGEVALPYGPILLQLVNLSTTTSATGNYSLIGLDY